MRSELQILDEIQKIKQVIENLEMCRNTVTEIILGEECEDNVMFNDVIYVMKKILRNLRNDLAEQRGE